MTKTKEEIQRSIDQSTKEWKERRERNKEYSRKLKMGIKFCKDNKVKLIDVGLFDYNICLGYFVTKHGIIRYSYAICSPKDSFNYRTALGIIGNRFLKDEFIVPNLIIGINEYSKVSDFEIESICKNNFKYFLEMESYNTSPFIKAPKKLFSLVREYGVVY